MIKRNVSDNVADPRPGTNVYNMIIVHSVTSTREADRDLSKISTMDANKGVHWKYADEKVPDNCIPITFYYINEFVSVVCS